MTTDLKTSSPFFALLMSVIGSGCGDASSPAEAEDMVVGGAMGGAPSDEPIDEGQAPVADCPASTQGFATEVIAHSFGEGQDYGQDDFPEAVLGGPQGGDCCSGSLDVTSLGDGGHVVLGFGDRRIIDGDGPDFIVFENAFWAGGDPDAPVAELGQVSVSIDGEEWFDFSCEPGGEPPYGNCAGWRPIYANVLLKASASPFDPEVSGGAPYDLAELGLEEARYVRVTDVAGDEAVFDLDAVSVVNGRCE